jgi:AmiR/NasT family two-component response regulator
VLSRYTPSAVGEVAGVVVVVVGREEAAEVGAVVARGVVAAVVVGDVCHAE